MDDILNEHRKMMLLTGKFSDFQIENLKNFALVAFDNIEKIEMSYDVEIKTGSGNVSYGVVLNKKQDNLEKRKQSIVQWVRHLLFNEIKVEIKVSYARPRKSRKS